MSQYLKPLTAHHPSCEDVSCNVSPAALDPLTLFIRFHCGCKFVFSVLTAPVIVPSPIPEMLADPIFSLDLIQLIRLLHFAFLVAVESSITIMSASDGAVVFSVKFANLID